MSNYFYDDYYDEDYIMEEAFEIQKKELIEAAREHLKKEVQEEIDRLKEENKMLQDIKADYNAFKQKKQELELLKVELENEYKEKYKSLERDFVRMNMEDFLNKANYLFTPLYYVDYKYIKREKCSLCDDNREYEITTPDGEKHKIKCKCSNSKTFYYVEDVKRFSVNIKKIKDQKKVSLILERNYSDDYSLIKTDIIEKFDENNIPKIRYGVTFSSKEEAQKYADYLNSLEENQ